MVKHTSSEIYGDHHPALTIIIVTYNAEPYIDKCLKSIINSVSISCQIIIIDGLSTDKTLTLIDKYKKYIDVLISEIDQGIYDAMNKALPYIKGRWVLFLGADDQMLPTFSQIENYLIQEDTIYYGNCKNEAHLLGGIFTSYRIAKMNICHQCVFYPKKVFDKYKYNLKYRVFADYLLNIQCWGDRNFKKVYKNIDVAYYDMQGFSSKAGDNLFREDKASLIKKYLGYFTYIRYKVRKYKESRNQNSKFF